MDDSILNECNETELLSLARVQNLGRLRRGLPKDVLVGLVSGDLPMEPRYLAGTSETRAKLQAFIWNNIERTRSQLPGCDGRCSTYPCSEGRHAACFGKNEDTVR